MAQFNFRMLYLLVSASLAMAYASTHATHRVRDLGDGKSVLTFHPEVTYETFGEGVDHPLSRRDGPDAPSTEQAALSFVQSKLNIGSDALVFHSGFEGQTAKHAYIKQQFHNITVANAVANVALNENDKVVAFGSSFVKPTTVAQPVPDITVKDAIAKAESALSATRNDWPTSLEYVAKEDNTVALAHVVQVQNSAHWFQAFIDAHSGELIQAVDFTAQSAFKVVPFNKQDRTQGGFQLLSNPEDTAASPNGWNTGSTGTSGNNAISFKGSQSSITQESASGLVFNYTDNDSQAPTAGQNLDAARTNAFYIVNTVHDTTYRYGFTEAAFNFQNDNFGKGGKANDRITISVQDKSGTDNADFSTPPDGQSGQMRMFLWDETTPDRDGALENDIVQHEATHGTSNRLTGGGTGSCLQSTEAGGMGEGWSDAFADWAEQTAAIGDFTMGSYVTNDPAGIRTHPYSRSSTTNPLTYASVATLNEVHNIGEVWANMLHNVLAALVDAHGFSTTARTNPSGSEGNIVFMHLFIDQLALQPCSPTFLTARDSWIQADQNRFGGANKCLLWKAFASRGLGVKAANHKNDGTVPSGC